jgi:alpha-D-ribose 1-methylphosphonate 5-triphosphate synthase subunit PhnH
MSTLQGVRAAQTVFIEIIDAFSMPKLLYSIDRKTFIPHPDVPKVCACIVRLVRPFDLGL